MKISSGILPRYIRCYEVYAKNDFPPKPPFYKRIVSRIVIKRDNNVGVLFKYRISVV